MPSRKKPWRTIKVADLPPDHFTFEQAEAAVLAYFRRHGIPVRRDVVEFVSRNAPSPSSQPSA